MDAEGQEPRLEAKGLGWGWTCIRKQSEGWGQSHIRLQDMGAGFLAYPGKGERLEEGNSMLKEGPRMAWGRQHGVGTLTRQGQFSRSKRW